MQDLIRAWEAMPANGCAQAERYAWELRMARAIDKTLAELKKLRGAKAPEVIDCYMVDSVFKDESCCTDGEAVTPEMPVKLHDVGGEG